jgi:hypothetical protein
MKHIKKFNQEDVRFSSKSLEKGKDEKPTIKTSTEDQEKIEKEFKKELDKVQKFEAFIDIHIDNVENIEVEEEDNEFESEEEEGSGCGCCDDCSGSEGCDCGCEDCKCGSEGYCDSCDRVDSQCVCGDEGTEDLLYHIAKAIPVTESIFRPGSKKFFSLIKEARRLFESGKVELSNIDKELFESTEIGRRFSKQWRESFLRIILKKAIDLLKRVDLKKVFNNIKPVNFGKHYNLGKKPYRFIEKSKIAKGKCFL